MFGCYLNILDFSAAGSSISSETQLEGYQTVDMQVLPGRRKRKVLSGEEIAGSPPAGSGAPGGWVRAALGYVTPIFT